MSSVSRVDAHIHFWDPARTPQPWMTEAEAAINRAFGPSDLEPLLVRNGVDSVILVQGANLDSDTDDLLEAARSNPWIGAVTAWLCLEEPARAARRLDELADQPKVRAIRHLIHNEPEHWIMRPAVLESIALLEQRDITLEAPVVFPNHFDDIGELAERFPRLRLVIDHLGKPPTGTPEMARWEQQLRRVAEHPNVLAKVSGLNTTISRSWTSDDFRAGLEVALEAFGPDRLMCGSDWPVALLNGTYDTVWQAHCELAKSVAGEHADALLGGNACRIYQVS
ncbi:MAG: amidohydrolase family protein [Solirubrobacteraceae bacterium]|jgi:L-fuconolactonase